MSHFIPTSTNNQCATTCPSCGHIMKATTEKFIMIKVRLHFKVCKNDKIIDYNKYIKNNNETCDKLYQQANGCKKNTKKERKCSIDKLV